ncbi:hypothetical protein A2U01_0086980, partial [Trifolium medium]|nr:hypothetical protein [Trifolium medium]
LGKVVVYVAAVVLLFYKREF